MIHNKKAFEMSVGLIVVLILSILIFSLSMYFVFKWFGQAEQLKAEIDKQTKEQILQALKSGNQLVAIPIAVQEVKRGGAATFGAGIRFVGPDKQKDFSMATSFSNAYTPDGKEIPVSVDYINEKWLGTFSTTAPFTLRKNEEKLVPLLIKADVNIEPNRPTPKGDYVFNVCVYDAPLRSDGSPPAECSAGQYKNSPNEFYTARLYQVTVKVI